MHTAGDGTPHSWNVAIAFEVGFARLVARPRSFSERLGTRIRTRRKAKDWSQARLAEAVDLGANYIGILERGVKLPTLDTLVAVAKALGCSPVVLLDDAHAKDPWMDELVTVAATVPKGRRELVLAVLRAMAAAPSSG